MIRVNLLEGAADTRAQQRAKSVAAKTTQQILMVAGALLLLLTVVAVDYYISEQRLAEANRELEEQQRIASELKSDREKKDLLEKQIRSLQERIKVIDDLQKTQQGPSSLLALIDQHMPRNLVVLDRVGQTGSNLSIEGVSKTETAIADFARGLELNSNNLFSNVTVSTQRTEIQVPDDASDSQSPTHTEVVFKFTLTTQYTPTKVGQPSDQAAGAEANK